VVRAGGAAPVLTDELERLFRYIRITTKKKNAIL
jgi:hypothetical protein